MILNLKEERELFHEYGLKHHELMAEYGINQNVKRDFNIMKNFANVFSI